MPSVVTADPELIEAFKKTAPLHQEFVNDMNQAMRDVTVDHTAFVSRPVDKDGNPLGPATDQTAKAVDVEAVLERAHQKRVEQGKARSSVEMVDELKARDAVADAAPPAKPSLVVTLQAELDGMCTALGEMRANYTIQERQLLAAIEAKAAQLAMAKEMSK